MCMRKTKRVTKRVDFKMTESTKRGENIAAGLLLSPPLISYMRKNQGADGIPK